MLKGEHKKTHHFAYHFAFSWYRMHYFHFGSGLTCVMTDKFTYCEIFGH